MATPPPHVTSDIMQSKINTIYMICMSGRIKTYIEVLPGMGMETYNSNLNLGLLDFQLC